MAEIDDHGITPADVIAVLGEHAGKVSQETINESVATVRRLVGWHVFPERTETLTVDGTGDRVLFLPTKRLVEVQEVLVDGVATDMDKVHSSADGIIELPRAPRGMGRVKVTIRHGYESAPDLRGVCIKIAARASRPQEAMNVGRISVGASGAMGPQSTEWRIIDLYKMGPMP